MSVTQVVANTDMSAADRAVLTGFLSAKSDDGSGSPSGEIVGILKQMHEEMRVAELLPAVPVRLAYDSIRP